METEPTPQEGLGTSQERGTAPEEAEGVREGAGEARKRSSQRVEQLSLFLRRQQEVVYKQQNISRYFPPPVQKIAMQCWDQIHPNITTAIEGKYGRVLEEWNVTNKLAELDRYQVQNSKTTPTWRPTGIPEEDSGTAESAEASQLLPDFETKITEVQALSRDLECRLREREAEVGRLEQEILSSLNELKQTTSSYPPPSSITH